MSKNIHDLSDDEFDDLFRDSAEKSDIGFDPGAWNKMSQKLDAASAPPSSTGKGGNPLTKWGLPAVVVLLLLITGTYFLLRKPSVAVTETKGSSKENSVKQTDKVGEKDVATDKVGTQNKENAKENSISNDKVKTDKIITANIKEDTKKTKETLKSTDKISDKIEKPVSLKVKDAQGNNKADVAAKTVSAEQEEVLPVKGETTVKVTLSDKKVADNTKSSSYKGTKKPSGELTPISEANATIATDGTETKSQLLVVSEKKENNAKSKINKRQSVLRENNTTNNPTLPSKTDDISSSNVGDNELKTTTQNQNLAIDSVNTIEKMQWTPIYRMVAKQTVYAVNLKLPDVRYEDIRIVCAAGNGNTAFRKGLNIRLAISPDLSFIPSNKIFKVGNNWAAILEYRFNNRISIQSGVIRSMKYYGALPSQYEWNVYWTMPSPLKDIDATCKMLDIPLNLRYDISQKSNSRWFVSGGFTSYIMLKEEYRYNYENPADPNIKRTSWEGKTGAYPFSVLNLSAGYERQLFRRLTFQAEPFYKAPLGKVGYGKVRLATAGVFFSVKYPF